MNEKNKGLPVESGKDYKKLPLRARVRLLLAAKRLLEVQREGENLLEMDSGGGFGELKTDC